MSSTTARRLPISKKVRFEVFKRDSFSCRYCGKIPSLGAILNIDHVVPVSAGGTNDYENLVTACFDCNSGKSDRHLNNLTPLKNELQILASFKEYKEQVKEYFKFINEKNNAYEQSVDLVLKNIGDPNKDFSEQQRQSIKMFLKKRSLDDLIEYSMMTNVRLGSKSSYSKFKYFCGIFHTINKNKEKSDVAN